jgi:hypothetical protein
MAAALCLALSLLAPLQATAKSPALKALSYRFYEGRVLVSLQVGDPLQRDDVKEAIQSTRPITITYLFELRKNRSLWPDKTVVGVVMRRTVTYDNLTRQYAVSTTVDGKEVDSLVLDDWEALAELLGTVTDLTLGHVGDLQPGEKLYLVRAKVHLLSDSFVWIFPKDVETDWKEIELVTP